MKRMIVTGVLLVSVLVATGLREAGGAQQLSLQLRRSGEESVVPPETPADTSFARFDRAVGQFGIVSGSFDGPIDLAVDSDEYVYVLDRGNSRVQRLDANGDYVSQFGSSGSREGEFKDPQSIAVDRRGNIRVVDAGNHRVMTFSSDGRYLTAVGASARDSRSGTRTGEFNRPQDVAFDGDNNMYVADTGNDRIQKFNPGGGFVEEWNAFNRRFTDSSTYRSISSLAYDDDRFGYLLALSGKKIQRFELDGRFKESVELDIPGTFEPVRMEVDNENDYIFLADRAGNRIVRLSKNGAFQGEVTGTSPAFSGPAGLAVDAGHKRLYVADSGNNLIQRFYLK